MTRIHTRGQNVRRYILEHIEKHPTDINKVTAAHFGTTRQAVNKHLRRLVGEKALDGTGNTRNRVYKLCPLNEWRQLYPIAADLAEDVIWRSDIVPVLGQMSENAKDIWHYGFTEMFNNAIDHSEGKNILVWITKTAATTEMTVMDDGVGIFKKIQNAMNLLDERHAVLELAKGKLTTDPANHTGEGVFFSSRMFDKFSILSGSVHFSHRFGDDLDWILERASDANYHTFVGMSLSNHTSRTVRKVFDQYTSGDEYRFSKTVVPVELAQYGDDKLISRSQAKRLLARIELFKIVVLDFTRVPTVGQAFADEIFRVFAQAHPEIELIPLHASSEVRRIIGRAKSGLTS
jgi:hypothetical protein